MRPILCMLVLLVCGPVLAGCGGTTQNTCSITANVVPATGTADHALAPPGNQVQFAMQSSVAGNCPLAADTQGTWSTSDGTNTSINQQGLATCVNATASPATISNSGMVRGIKGFTPASLTCH
jgi:hypothetical protein